MKREDFDTEEEYREFRAKANARNRKYYSKPSVKDARKKYKREYERRPEVKAKAHAKNISPARREYIKQYRADNHDRIIECRNTPENKRKKSLQDKRYRENRKQADDLWMKNERNRLTRFRENNPEIIKEYNKKYYTSEKGKIQSSKQNHRRLSMIKSRPFDLTNDKINMIRARDKCCVYCGAQGALELDHIVPLKLGGNSLFENFVMACPRCNRTKSGREVHAWLKSQGVNVPKIVTELLMIQKVKALYNITS